MRVEIIPASELFASPWHNPRCSAEHTGVKVTDKARLLRRPDVNQCYHSAAVRIDEKPFCRIHGGFHLLRYAVEKGEI